jgi:hypothetical protein
MEPIWISTVSPRWRSGYDWATRAETTSGLMYPGRRLGPTQEKRLRSFGFAHIGLILCPDVYKAYSAISIKTRRCRRNSLFWASRAARRSKPGGVHRPSCPRRVGWGSANGPSIDVSTARAACADRFLSKRCPSGVQAVWPHGLRARLHPSAECDSAIW